MHIFNVHMRLSFSKILQTKFSYFLFFKVGHSPLYVTFSIRPFVRPSVAHHILVTVHHLIIIFGICKMMISPGDFFILFLILIFWAVRGVKKQKIAPN